MLGLDAIDGMLNVNIFCFALSNLRILGEQDMKGGLVTGHAEHWLLHKWLVAGTPSLALYAMSLPWSQVGCHFSGTIGPKLGQGSPSTQYLMSAQVGLAPVATPAEWAGHWGNLYFALPHMCCRNPLDIQNPVDVQWISLDLAICPLDIHWIPLDSTGVQFGSQAVLYMSSQWPGNVQYPTGHPLDIDWILTGHLGIIKFTLSKVKYKGEY